MPIRVLIIDDHALVRAGLRLLLERHADMSVVGEGTSSVEAVQLTRLLKPDVVLLDLLLPGGSGLDALAEIRTAAPNTQLLVLSMQDDPSYLRAAFRLGAAGYLLKDAADTELISAVRQVAAGGRYLHPRLGVRLLARESEDQARASLDSLSPRQQEILRLAALGHTNREIAAELRLSLRSIEQHRLQLSRKLRLGTRAELVRYARAHGLLRLPASA